MVSVCPQLPWYSPGPFLHSQAEPGCLTAWGKDMKVESRETRRYLLASEFQKPLGSKGIDGRFSRKCDLRTRLPPGSRGSTGSGVRASPSFMMVGLNVHHGVHHSLTTELLTWASWRRFCEQPLQDPRKLLTLESILLSAHPQLPALLGPVDYCVMCPLLQET